MSPHQPSSSLPQPGAFAEVHTVETPEQIRLEFALAGIGSRFLALCIDFLIQVGVALGAIVVLTFLSILKIGSGWFGAVLVVALFLLYYGYFIIFEILWNGQTPGKRRIGLRVVKDSGRPLSAAEVVGRNLLRIVDQLPGFYAVGLIAMICNSSNKRLGDMVAGSIVIREGSLIDLGATWAGSPEASAVPVPGANLLSPEDLALVNSFLVRRYQLDFETRRRMADEIFAHLARKISLSEEQRLSPESALESLASQGRSFR
jgi:uncharacterized RDD family membrane protein YckC